MHMKSENVLRSYTRTTWRRTIVQLHRLNELALNCDQKYGHRNRIDFVHELGNFVLRNSIVHLALLLWLLVIINFIHRRIR